MTRRKLKLGDWVEITDGYPMSNGQVAEIDTGDPDQPYLVVNGKDTSWPPIDKIKFVKSGELPTPVKNPEGGFKLHDIVAREYDPARRGIILEVYGDDKYRCQFGGCISKFMGDEIVLIERAQ